MRFRRVHQRVLPAIALAVALSGWLVFAATAVAGTASVSSTTLSYVAAAGEVNNVSMFAVEFGDQGLGQAVRELGSAPVVAGAGCVAVDEQMAWCGASPTAMNADLGDMDDELRSNDLGGTARGGSGNDILQVSQFHSGALFGDSGDDSLWPAFGTWTLQGGSGNDDIRGACAGSCAGAATLTVSGGTDRDIFSYAGRSEPLTVTLDGVANDGSNGQQNDNIGADVEDLVGGDGADEITGSSVDNHIEGASGAGAAGSDVVLGAGGNDTLTVFGSDNRVEGGGGSDLIRTGGGADADRNTLMGGPDRDAVDFSLRAVAVGVTLDGTANDGVGHDQVSPDVEDLVGTEFHDSLTGNAGANDLSGGAGQDVLRGGAGADSLRGGRRSRHGGLL